MLTETVLKLYGTGFLPNRKKRAVRVASSLWLCETEQIKEGEFRARVKAGSKVATPARYRIRSSDLSGQIKLAETVLFSAESTANSLDKGKKHVS